MLLERQRFEFGDFLLDAKEKILLRGGKPISITPKSFQLLFVLVENHGHLVEKDELMREVWTNSFVEEANLAFTIGLLRKTLADDAQKPRFIETVPKRGYRFIAAVKRLEAKEEGKCELIDDSAGQSNGAIFSPTQLSPRVSKTESQSPAVLAVADWRPQASVNRSEETVSLSEFSPDFSHKAIAEKRDAVDWLGRNRNVAAFAVVLFLVGSIALGYYFFFQKNATIEAKKSIAVLPLKPINTANRDELYEIGIADSLIYRLSSVKGLVVRPLSAIRKYADIEQDPLAAGRELRVEYVLAANYQLANGKIRVTAQLFNAANGQIEETYKSENETGDIFAMQDRIASEVGSKLLARFNVASGTPVAKRRATNEEAYRLYLQGMYLYDKRNLEDSRKAVEVLEQAVRLDPNYALAWAGKAHAHRAIANHLPRSRDNLGREINSSEEYQKSIEAINKALALDENLSEAYSALCENKMYYEYDFAGAERACQRAVELDPNSSLSHQIYSRYLNSRGRSDEAINEIKTAIDLEPESFYNQRNLGVSLYFARRYEEAVVQFKRVIAMDQDFASTYMWLLFALEKQGKESEASEWFMKTPEMRKADEETVQVFKSAYQTSGWQGVLRERIKRFDKSSEAYYLGATYNAQIGDKDKTFEYLEKSYQRHELWVANLQVDPLLDSLRDDPRFDELIRRVRLK